MKECLEHVEDESVLIEHLFDVTTLIYFDEKPLASTLDFLQKFDHMYSKYRDKYRQ